jgi:hypothetical protein
MFEKELSISGKGATVHLGLRTRGENIAGLTGAGFVLGVLRVRETAARRISSNNLMQIGIGLTNYHDTNGGHFPPPAIYDKSGKPLLSWRVAILPYIEQYNLYQAFHLDEPWDSPHNIKLLDKMPKIYAPLRKDAPPGEATTGSHLTYYQVFVGPSAIFQPGAAFKGTGMRAGIPDGTSNTILVVEAGEPVPWSKPDDIPFAPDKPLPKLGGLKFRAGFHALMADGSVHFIYYDVSEKTLKAAITANGGEVLGKDW